jgi:hypothetical protein
MAKGKRTQQVAQIRAAFQMTRKADPRITWVLVAWFVGVLAVAAGVGFAVGHPVYGAVLGVILGALAVTIVFGRRAERAAYAQVEGQPGAAAAVLDTLRRGWTVTPAVAVDRQGDVVHRAVGRPGVVLVGEGPSPARVTAMLAAEHKRVARVVPDLPVHEVVAGNADGQVPLKRLTRHVMRLPGRVPRSDLAEVNRRLRALPAMNTPMPKGPPPKGMRAPRMPRSRVR